MLERQLRFDRAVLANLQNLAQQLIDILFGADVRSAEPVVVVASIAKRRVKPVCDFMGIVIDIVPDNHIFIFQFPLLETLIRMRAVDGVHPAGARAIGKLAQGVTAEAGRGVDCADVVAFRTDILQAGIAHGLGKEVINRSVLLQRIRFGRNPRDVFGQVAVGRQVNILRCFQSADETERNFNVARFHSVKVSNGLFVNGHDMLAGFRSVHIRLCLLENACELLLCGGTVLLGFVVQKLVIVRLQCLVLICLLLLQNCLVRSFGSGQGVIIFDLRLILSRELVVSIARFGNGVVAVFTNRTDRCDQVDDPLHIRIFHRHNVAHVVQTVCLAAEPVIRSQRVISLLRCHLVDNIIVVTEATSLYGEGQESIKCGIAALDEAGILVRIDTERTERNNDLCRRFRVRGTPRLETTVFQLLSGQADQRFIDSVLDILAGVVVRSQRLDCHCRHVDISDGCGRTSLRSNCPAAVFKLLRKNGCDQRFTAGSIVILAVQRKQRPDRTVDALLIHISHIIQRSQKIVIADVSRVFADCSYCKGNTGVFGRSYSMQLPRIVNFVLHIGYDSVIVTAVVACGHGCVASGKTNDCPLALYGVNNRVGDRRLQIGLCLVVRRLPIRRGARRFACVQLLFCFQELLIRDRADLVFLFLGQCVVCRFGFVVLRTFSLRNWVGQSVDQRFNPGNLQLGDLRGRIGDSLPHGGADFGFCAKLGELIQCSLCVCDDLLVSKRQVGRILRKLVCGGCYLRNSSKDRQSLIASHELVVVG